MNELQARFLDGLHDGDTDLLWGGIRFLNFPWKPFGVIEFECFSGVQSPNPVVHYDEKCAYVLDGNIFSIFDENNKERRIIIVD